MKDDYLEQNPYAPPKEDAPPPPKASPKKRRKLRSDLREALERLNAHLADATAVMRDQQAAGPRIRVATIVCGLLLLPAGILIVLGQDSLNSALLPIGAGFGIVVLLLFVLLLVVDLTILPASGASSPDSALKSALKAVAANRFGYFWARLCPTARETPVDCPELGPIPVGGGQFVLSSEVNVKGYFSSFARPGQGQIRTMRVKRITLITMDGDVAVVSADLLFQAWPRWVTIVTAVGFVIFRPLVLIGAILFYVTRKRYNTRISKTMLRGKNGAWYIYDADLLEGSAEQEV